MVVGIIGGVASGKSAVTEAFRKLGAVVVSADQIGHDVLAMPEVVLALVELFGKRVLVDANAPPMGVGMAQSFEGRDQQQGASIDRKKVAQLVFGDTDEHRKNRAALEAIVHPRIRAIARERLAVASSEHKSRWIVLDAPLLIEGGWVPFCDKIIFVETDYATRRQRALGRGWTEQQWLEREAAQRPLEEKRSVATDVLPNDGSIPSLESSLASLVASWE